MSHFTVLVVGDDPELKLAPYHEYESTGEKNEYVQDVDITEECRKKYEEATEKKVFGPEGSFSSYDDRCYREFTEEEMKECPHIGGTGCCKVGVYTSKDWGDGKGYRAKLHCIPEGYEERAIPMREIKSFVSWVQDYHCYKVVFSRDELSDSHKYGYILIEEDKVTVIDCTNPNAKWDWYVLGGRWGDFFKLKEGGRSSSARKCDIDFAGMQKESEDAYVARWRKVHECLAGREIPKWNSFKDQFDDIDKARDAWWSQKIIQDFGKLNIWDDIEEYDCTEEEYRLRGNLSAIPTFAVVLDGKWYERGEMGWWAAVKDEKEIEDWSKEFNDLVASLPDETLLSVYDCHI